MTFAASCRPACWGNWLDRAGAEGEGKTLQRGLAAASSSATPSALWPLLIPARPASCPEAQERGQLEGEEGWWWSTWQCFEVADSPFALLRAAELFLLPAIYSSRSESSCLPGL